MSRSSEGSVQPCSLLWGESLLNTSFSPPLRIETVADGEHDLVVAQIAAIRSEIRLQVVMRAQRGLDRPRDEVTVRAGGDGRGKLLLSQENFKAQPVADLP